MSDNSYNPQRIPMVNTFGPGSQTNDEDGVLDYMSMPTSMSTYTNPALPEPDELEDIEAALTLLQKVATALEDYSGKSGSTLFDLENMGPNDRSLINQILGVGEVSATIDGLSPIHIQESVMAGLWRVHHLDDNEQVIRDCLEVADIPSVVRSLAFQFAKKSVDAEIPERPNILNSPAILVELDDKVRQHRQDDDPHVINLTLLPLSPEDLMLLGERLGVGPVTILSRGYGNCRIGSTNCDATWWIKYFNSEDALILNTIEIVDVPEVAVAAPEDIHDSAHRLKEILDIYQ